MELVSSHLHTVENSWQFVLKGCVGQKFKSKYDSYKINIGKFLRKYKAENYKTQIQDKRQNTKRFLKVITHSKTFGVNWSQYK